MRVPHDVASRHPSASPSWRPHGGLPIIPRLGRPGLYGDPVAGPGDRTRRPRCRRCYTANLLAVRGRVDEEAARMSRSVEIGEIAWLTFRVSVAAVLVS